MKDIKPKIMLDADFFTNKKFRALAHSVGEKACYKVLVLFGLMRSAGGKLDSSTPGFWPWLAKEIDVSTRVVEAFLKSLCRREICEHGVYEFLDYDGRYYWAQQQLEDIESYRRKCEQASEKGRRRANARWGNDTPDDASCNAPCIASRNAQRNACLMQIYLSTLSLNIKRMEWNEKLAERPPAEREKVWELAREFGRECVAHYLRVAAEWLDGKCESGDPVAVAATFMVRDKAENKGFFRGGMSPQTAARRPERRKVSFENQKIGGVND